MEFTHDLIAPCGINCGVCIAYLRDKNKCYGCLNEEKHKATHCMTCALKNCVEHQESEFTYCYECTKFPCTRMKKLDKRYVKNYQTSLIENLKTIHQMGMEAFLSSEVERWHCKNCGEVLSVHRKECMHCKEPFK